MRRSLYRILCVAVVIACDKPAPAPESIADAPEWHLSPTPRVSIGVAEGDDRYMFRYITGVFRTRGGNIFVADRDPSLTLFDSAGRFIRHVGGKGSGPGEFQYLMSFSPFAYRGDSIAVWDFLQRRVSVFGTEGNFGRTENVTMPARSIPPGNMESQTCCRIANAFRDGSLVLELPSIIPRQPGPPRYAITTLMRVSADLARWDTIGSFRDRYFRYDAGAPSFVRHYHLGGPFVFAVAGDTVFGGNGDGQWLIRHAPGAVPDTIHLAGSSIPVTDSIKAAHAQAYRDEFKRRPQFFEGRLEDAFEGGYANNVPAYTQIRSDNAGHLWLAQWALPFSQEPLVFHVYSTRGKPVARIKLPSGTWILHITGDQVTIVEHDADDIQYVRVYDIIRPPR